MKRRRGGCVANGERKKRDFPGWALVKRADPGKRDKVQNEQPVVEEIVQAQEPAKASEQAVEEQPQAHTEAEAEDFTADVVEVTEQVAESEKAQPEAEVVAQPEPVVEETPEPMAIEREELPLPEDVNAEEVSPEEWQAEAETVEIVEAAEEEAAKEEITDEELEAQALAAEAAEEAVMVVPPVEESSRWKKSLRSGKTDQRFLRAPETQPVKNRRESSVPDLSACSAVKKSTMICLRSWKSSF